jgi:hypothetical protein
VAELGFIFHYCHFQVSGWARMSWLTFATSLVKNLTNVVIADNQKFQTANQTYTSLYLVIPEPVGGVMCSHQAIASLDVTISIAALIASEANVDC